MSRTIGVITTSRADYGYYRPLLRALLDEPGISLALYATGSHLEPAFGTTINEIQADGLDVTATVPLPLTCDRPVGSAQALAAATHGFAALFDEADLELAFVFGDRFEMLGAALAAAVCRVPIAHIAGGEVTEGSLDDSYRHALTKLSHLHLPNAESAARRIIQMGEEPWRVRAVGSLSLDNLLTVEWLGETELAERLGFSSWSPPVLVAYHPDTVHMGDTARQVENLIAALSELNRPLIITAANHDAGGRTVNERLRTFAATRENARFTENLGWQTFASVLRCARAFVGNSSSGLVEAPSFGVPVVNIGTRQKGRLRAANVIDVGYETAEISAGLARALDPAFRSSIAGQPNPYGDGRATARILEVLRALPPRPVLLAKRFRDI